MQRNFLPVVVVCLFLALTAFSQSIFRVNEHSVKAFLRTGELQIQVPFENAPNAAAKIKIEILGVDDSVLAQTEIVENLKRGSHILKTSVTFDSSHAESPDLLWNRLRYTVAPDGNANFSLFSGMLSLSEIMPEIFEIRAVSSKSVYAGMDYLINVRAFHPISNQPSAGVKITGEIELDLQDKKAGEPLKLTTQATTGGNGYAVLNFKIPEGVKLDRDGGVSLKGERGGLLRQANQDLNTLRTRNNVYLNTDKPIYQPGQEFHIRGMYIAQNGLQSSSEVQKDRELVFLIEDEDNTVLYRQAVKTSRFGIASIDWKIPENAKLGSYRVKIEGDEDLDADSISFKVSRYDLPNFKVSVKPDKNYYLPDQNMAEVTVSADYLFGKPVTQGTVKVVREDERTWNYREQKWEIEEKETFEGKTGADGKFVARIDLTKAHNDLKEEEYRRSEDLNFAAYFTDSSTNRTEQKRFDVRVTKEAVHIYFVKLGSGDKNPKMPLKFYVSTFYADGAPAECDLEIKGKYENEEEKQTRTLFKTKTNRFGAGKVEFAAPKPEDEDFIEDLELKAFASDKQNQTGTQEENISFEEDEKQIKLDTTKTIYKTGEAIGAKIITSEPDAEVFVDIVSGYSVIVSQLVKVKNGQADVKIPYRPDFKGEIAVAAYFNDGEEDVVKDVQGIIYPAPTGLDLTATAEKTTYRPGEEASVDFNVAAFDKSQIESALGVVVFDKAIDERAATDTGFGGYYRSSNAFGDFAWIGGDSNSFGAITVSRLNRLDQKAKIPQDLQLAAELLLADEYYRPHFFASNEYGKNQAKTFEHYLKHQFDPVHIILDNVFKMDFTHPTDENSLRSILKSKAIDFTALRDPWGMPYKASVETEREYDALYIRSAGADKIAGSADDFIVLQMKFQYFTPTGRIFDQAAGEFHEQTGEFIRDYQTLRGEMLKKGVELDLLKDRYGHAYEYEFGVDGGFYVIKIKSDGKDGKPDKNEYYGDDFSVWTNRIDYFAETQVKVQNILDDYSKTQMKFPGDEAEFRRILQGGGINFDDLRDGYGQKLYLAFSTYSRFADKVKTEVVSSYGGQGKEKTTILPVTQTVSLILMKSAGKDAIKQNADDFTLAALSGIIAEQSKDDAAPKKVRTETIFTGGKGAVRGVVVDANNAIIAKATVSAVNDETKAVTTSVTDDQGFYLLPNLPLGNYSIKAESAGFKATIVSGVPVRASTLTSLNFSLEVGAISEVVTVSSEAVVMNTSSATISETQIQELPINGRKLSESYLLKPGITPNKKIAEVNILEENSTPKLREYFPETLLWQPEIVTDKNGQAQVKFKLGDNITTWKIYAIATDMQGKVGLAEKEIQAFQPFFVDLEPPKILTVGDEISLPAQVRNYTEVAQKVDVSMDKADWFSFLEKTENAETRQIEVAPNETQNAVFGYRVELATKIGKQKVTALAGRESDAIEKTTQVHPNGQEIVQTQGEIFRDSTAFNVNFPADALPGTPQAALKIYPNLYSHIAESVDGLLKRPYGCGEQTISSTYPNIMILKILKNEPDSKLKTQARKYLQEGYERLLGYQKEEGGFAVWVKESADVSLTAYALRFLADAGEFIEVDDSISEKAGKWLAKQQRADGSWTKIYSWEKTEDRQRTKMISTYVARSLALVEKGKKEKSKEIQAVMQKAFAYLKERNDEIDEPYALANYALALLDAGDWQTAAPVVEKLESLAISESDRTYWNLETNTPFYGWGTPGRIETTALVVQALVKFRNQKSELRNQQSEVGSQNPKTEGLISRGTMFLLKNKDRYGVWYSTQATINVLDAILAVIGNQTGAENAAPRTAEIYVDGQHIKDISLPASNKMSFPLETELPVTNAASKIEVKISGNQTATMAQLVQRHYISWQSFLADGRNINQSRQIRMDYKCDKLNAKVMDEINCSVEAERVGFQGYGMLLAEIGIPPGADVERESLENVLRDDWSISRYDVLPDKIIVYMWARPGGTKFNFKFRPRYAINAVTASSDIYDYYNEEAKATLAPLKFVISE